MQPYGSERDNLAAEVGASRQNSSSGASAKPSKRPGFETAQRFLTKDVSGVDPGLAGRDSLDRFGFGALTVKDFSPLAMRRGSVSVDSGAVCHP